jgi:zeaxanthin glucosyltransferase
MDRACLTLTHAGLNTVLDSLAAGTPMIAMPITYEQPAIAARVKASGAGISIPPSRMTVVRLRDSVREVLQESSYRDRARCMAHEIREAGGARKAASVIERAG